MPIKKKTIAILSYGLNSSVKKKKLNKENLLNYVVHVVLVERI